MTFELLNGGAIAVVPLCQSLQSVITDLIRRIHSLGDVPFLQDVIVALGMVSPNAGKIVGLEFQPHCQVVPLDLARAEDVLVYSVATGGDETNVAEVANDLGVWDLGRFAARYRQLFGELPSNTLRRPA